jgi:GT2 family glycosyltransferase
MYLSEADLSEKQRSRGYRVVVNPEARVTHDMETAGTTGVLRNIRMTEPVRAYLVGRNRILYMRMHRNRVQFVVFLASFSQLLPCCTLCSSFWAGVTGRTSSARTREGCSLRWWDG